MYAVPLFRVPRKTVRRDDSEGKAIDFSVPLSSATLWRDLFSSSVRRGRRPVAVVVELPADRWPVDVYVLVSAAMAGPLLQGLRGDCPKGLHVSGEAMDFVLQAAASGCSAVLEARAASPPALGALLRRWLATGATAWSHADETVEVVLRAPVPAKAVSRLVPLSQTNVKARARRDLEKGLPHSADDA